MEEEDFTLEKAIRIKSVPRTILQLEPEKRFVFARWGRMRVGDVLRDEKGRKYIVVGDAPPRKDIRRMDFQRVGNQRGKLPEYLTHMSKDPDPEELMRSHKDDTWTLTLGFKPDLTEMKYSYRLTAYRYSSTRSDLKPWLIDAMFSKKRWSEEEARGFASGGPVVAYGFCRWSNTGYLRYHILSAFPSPKG